MMRHEGGTMTSLIRQGLRLACAAVVALTGFAATATAEEIAIAQYGSSTSAMPWAVALEKGFFKDAGVDITAIRASAGGSADIRNMIAGGLPYAESALASVITASRSGADIRIVSENVDTVANFVWAAMPDLAIKSLSDIKGRRLTFTTPQSTSEVMDHLLVAKLGLRNDDVKYVATGPYGAALTALQANGADVALLAEPIFTLNADKYRALGWAREALPPLVSTVGVVPTDLARKHPEVIRGILLAHRRAVEFMRSNRQESAEIIGRVYKLEPAVVQAVLTELIDHPSEGGVPYFGLGDFVPDGIDRLMDGLKLINALDTGSGWRPLVDQSFLPPDLQRKF
jgi:NitT/TauT family transport system substrate-binding protein